MTALLFRPTTLWSTLPKHVIYAKIVYYLVKLLEHRKLSNLILFPAIRRIGIIRRWGRELACRSPQNITAGGNPKAVSTREKVLRLRLNQFAEGLRKVGFPEDIITRETAVMEGAVRREISRVVMAARAGKLG